MAKSVPYHPYGDYCLNCGHVPDDDDELRKCSGCKQACYCDKNCQKEDWKKVHKRECQQLQDETCLAKALAATDSDFRGIADSSMLRQKLNVENKSGALGFVVRQLANFLEESVHYWDPNGDYGSGMALGRMDILLDEVESIKESSIDWLKLSAVMFGTCMVHQAIDRIMSGKNDSCDSLEDHQAVTDDSHFHAFLYNFGELLDRVKLFAIFQQNDYSHLLPDTYFPLLRLREPVRVNGRYYLAERHLQVGDQQVSSSINIIKCFICGSNIPKGTAVIPPHQIDRRPDMSNLPRLVNYLPPRSPIFPHFSSAKEHRFQQRLKAWLNIVARIRTLPKEYVCGYSCEQHSIYGRMFEAHPLPKSNKEEE